MKKLIVLSLLSCFFSCSNDDTDPDPSANKTLEHTKTKTTFGGVPDNTYVVYYENGKTVIDSTFSGSGQLISHKTFSWAANTETITFHNMTADATLLTVNQYDNNGKILKTIQYNENEAVLFTTNFTYGTAIITKLTHWENSNIPDDAKTFHLAANGYVNAMTFPDGQNILVSLNGDTPQSYSLGTVDSPLFVSNFSFFSNPVPAGLQKTKNHINNDVLMHDRPELVAMSGNYYLSSFWNTTVTASFDEENYILHSIAVLEQDPQLVTEVNYFYSED